MFVKNYYKALVYDNGNFLTGEDETLFLMSTDGNARYVKPGNYSDFSIKNFLSNDTYFAPNVKKLVTSDRHTVSSINSNSPYTGVAFGDGDTPVTIDDYALSGNLLTGLSYSVTVTPVYDEDGFTVNCVYTLTNQNTDSVTIREVAMYGFQQAFASLSSTSASYYRFMTERTVLESPVTIPAGGVGQVNYTIRFNFPTA